MATQDGHAEEAVEGQPGDNSSEAAKSNVREGYLLLEKLCKLDIRYREEKEKKQLMLRKLFESNRTRLLAQLMGIPQRTRGPKRGATDMTMRRTPTMASRQQSIPRGVLNRRPVNQPPMPSSRKTGSMPLYEIGILYVPR